MAPGDQNSIGWPVVGPGPGLGRDIANIDGKWALECSMQGTRCLSAISGRIVEEIAHNTPSFTFQVIAVIEGQRIVLYFINIYKEFLFM